MNGVGFNKEVEAMRAQMWPTGGKEAVDFSL